MKNVKAKSYISFNLNFALLMLSAGRDEEASIALAKAVAGIEALPDDLFVDVEETEAE
jgi:hypothetical protein